MYAIRSYYDRNRLSVCAALPQVDEVRHAGTNPTQTAHGIQHHRPVGEPGKARSVLATFGEAEDLINIGAYARGSNSKIDYALGKIDTINDFLQQRFNESTPFKTTVEQLGTILSERKDEKAQPKNRRESDK